jgi:hypothetical protein
MIPGETKCWGYPISVSANYVASNFSVWFEEKYEDLTKKQSFDGADERSGGTSIHE